MNHKVRTVYLSDEVQNALLDIKKRHPKFNYVRMSQMVQMAIEEIIPKWQEEAKQAEAFNAMLERGSIKTEVSKALNTRTKTKKDADFPASVNYGKNGRYSKISANLPENEDAPIKAYIY